MDYEMAVSEDGQYIRIRALSDISIDLVERFSRDAVNLSRQTNINRILSDERGRSSRTTVTETYWFAHKDWDGDGPSHNWRVAVLKDPGGADYDCVETVMDNAGFVFRVFTQEAEAITWLLETPTD